MNDACGDIVFCLEESGVVDISAQRLLHPAICDVVRLRCQTFINERRQVNKPSVIRRAQMESESVLSDFHMAYGTGQFQISDDLWALGEEAWRSQVSHCTFNNPLINFPEILSIFKNRRLITAVSKYLGGEAKLGYAKVKKSYANDLEFKSFNHLFHVDDNTESGIVKLIMYLDRVESTLDGAFQYVRGSQKQKKDKFYFDTSEIVPESVHTLTGPAGTACLMDATGIHKENAAINTDRWVLICNFVVDRELYGEPLKVMRKDINRYRLPESFFGFCSLI